MRLRGRFGQRRRGSEGGLRLLAMVCGGLQLLVMTGWKPHSESADHFAPGSATGFGPMAGFPLGRAVWSV